MSKTHDTPAALKTLDDAELEAVTGGFIEIGTTETLDLWREGPASPNGVESPRA
jgi:bacteriocin-like protein